MKKVTYVGPNQTSFEGFDKSCERSCKGALIFLPGQQKLITDDELKHIGDNCSHEMPNIRCQKLPTEERVLLGKRKGAANSAKPRSPEKAKQFDGNRLHLEKAKEAAKKEGSSDKKEDKKDPGLKQQVKTVKVSAAEPKQAPPVKKN